MTQPVYAAPVTPSYAVTPPVYTAPVTPSYAAPLAPVAPTYASTAAPTTSAKFTVQMPVAAKVYVNGVLCPLQDGKQEFTVANLKAGQKYGYSLRVEMTNLDQPMTKTQQIVFQAGQHVQVNYNATSGVLTVKN